MLIIPAIDIINGEAVRLYQGDYTKKTVYQSDPTIVAKDFRNAGAQWVHLVDLDGAKSGKTPNLDIICRIKTECGLLCEIGGGIRNMEMVEAYISAGLDRVILGTAAVSDPDFLAAAVERYGAKIAVGVDIKDGVVAIKGWTESSKLDAFSFCSHLQSLGVSNIICTDISKDGAMQGTNLALYHRLSQEFSMFITASGGVSSLDDVRALRSMNLYAAIIGKAYYTGAVNLREALEVAK